MACQITVSAMLVDGVITIIGHTDECDEVTVSLTSPFETEEKIENVGTDGTWAVDFDQSDIINSEGIKDALCFNPIDITLLCSSDPNCAPTLTPTMLVCPGPSGPPIVVEPESETCPTQDQVTISTPSTSCVNGLIDITLQAVLPEVEGIYYWEYDGQQTESPYPQIPNPDDATGLITISDSYNYQPEDDTEHTSTATLHLILGGSPPSQCEYEADINIPECTVVPENVPDNPTVQTTTQINPFFNPCFLWLYFNIFLAVVTGILILVTFCLLDAVVLTALGTLLTGGGTAPLLAALTGVDITLLILSALSFVAFIVSYFSWMFFCRKASQFCLMLGIAMSAFSIISLLALIWFLIWAAIAVFTPDPGFCALGGFIDFAWAGTLGAITWFVGIAAGCWLNTS
jgi:hypothetical protein